MGDSVEALVCARLNGPYEVTWVKLGEMREDELVVRMIATGICHTDLACTNVQDRDARASVLTAGPGRSRMEDLLETC